MRRANILTLTLCMLGFSASAWAGPGHQRPDPRCAPQRQGQPFIRNAPRPGLAAHRMTGRSILRHAPNGHRSCVRHPQWSRGNAYGYGHHRHAVRPGAPNHRRPVVVKERYVKRGSVQKYSVTIRNAR